MMSSSSGPSGFSNGNESDNRGMFIVSLLDDIDYIDIRNNGTRDTQKVLVLQDEMIRLIKRPNFINNICQIFENTSRSFDENIEFMCQLLRFSALQCAAFAFALSRCQKGNMASDAQLLLRRILPRVSGEGLSDISEDLLVALVNFIVHSKELSQPEISGKFINALRTQQQQQQAANFHGVQSRPDKLENESILRLSEADQTSRNVNRNSIALALIERGPACSVTKDMFRSTLKDIGIPLSEEQLAIIIISLVNRFFSSASSEIMDEKWNLEVVADVLSLEARGLNWTTVARSFDQPFLSVRSESIFSFISKMFVRISGSPVPAAGLVGTWNNKQAQLAMLVLAANSPRNLVDFTAIVSAEQQLPNEVALPGNFSWLSLPLYSSLLHLASSGLAMEVLEALTVAASNFPEYVTICLAQLQDPNTGVRAEILRRTLPLFSGLPGSRPSSLIIMKKLLTVNPDLLVLLFRIALKRAKTVQDIIEIDARIKNFGQTVVRRLEEEAGLDENLGYWCIKADRSDFNLDSRLAMALEGNSQNARSLYNFAKLHIENLRPRASEGGLVSFESLSSILRALQNYQQIVTIEEIMSLASVASQQQKLSLQSQQIQSVAPSDAGQPSERNRGPESEEIDAEAHAYFRKIYVSEISIPDAIVLLKRFKSSAEKREQEIFRCMIHNLFDEYRFFHKYPDKELHLTGTLFGCIIQHQLISSITLGMALRYVLEALRKDPEQGIGNEKMFRFGRIALDQYRMRLGEWPQYCSHLIQINHLSRHSSDLYQEAQRALNNSNGPPYSSGVNDFGGSNGPDMSMPMQQQHPSMDESARSAISSEHSHEPALATASATLRSFEPPKVEADEVSVPYGDQSIPITEQQSVPTVIDRMMAVNIELANTVIPTEATRDKMHMIVNNLDKSNMEIKSAELKALIVSEYYNWFANYFVVKRISAQPNLHPIYMSLIDYLDNNELNSVILDSTYHNATKLLLSPKITTSSTERTLLRNLGIWLGLMTLARNKPLLHRRVEVKELLCWGYETGRLIAVCSFVARILEGIRESKVFKPPNPWLMGVLGVMRELYEVEDLKMNIKFEVQVLCKNINVKIEDIPKSNMLAHCKSPIKDSRNPDFNVKNSAAQPPPATPPMPSSGSSPQLPQFNSPPMPPMLSRSLEDEGVSKQSTDVLPSVLPPIPVPSVNSAALPASNQEQTVIPHLAAYITINPSLQFFTSNPAQRRLVSLAVDRAIRELIQPVAERSVTIASVTTKHLVVKDFSTEPNEQQLRRHAHLMIANLAGSLALVTCKEPLRLSICNHLRSLLAQTTNDQTLIEQIVNVCSNDNLDIGCKLIEKAATEKATRDCDEALSAAYQLRRKNREPGQPFIDTSVSKGAKYPRELPDGLKPRVGGLLPQQLQVYEGFQKQRPVVPPAVSTSSPLAGPISVAPTQAIETKTLPPNASPMTAPTLLSATQAMEGYQLIIHRIDLAMRSIQVQAAGRDVSLSMLGGENEILNCLREIIAVTQRIQPTVRNETAITFAENIFKRLLDSLAMFDNLRAEVLVGMLEAVRDVSGGPKKLSTEIVNWLTTSTNINVSDPNTRKMFIVSLVLLLRAKLLRSQDIDSYFSVRMDGGANMEWVELALDFVKQCLSENLAWTSDFSIIFETISKIRPANNVKRQLQKILTDIKAIANAKEEGKSLNSIPAVLSNADAGLRDHVASLLDKWMRIWNSVTDTLFGQFIQLMHQYGVLKTEDAADRFFRLATEICVEACSKTSLKEDGTVGSLNFAVMDALSKLFILLLRLAEKESADVAVKVNLLGRILHAVAKALLDEHASSSSATSIFDQRPYFRLFSNLAFDLGVPDSKKETNLALLPVYVTYAQVYASIQPSIAPGFSFSWLQLISQRSFIPHLMLAKGQKGWPYVHKLLLLLINFLQPFLKTVQLNEATRKLYRGTLRVLILLLHDFPDFLCEYQLSICDAIPTSCIQLRNLILSAFPRSMRLPDPFTPNLKVDLLPEIAQPPRLLAEYFTQITERGIRQHIGAYFGTKLPADLPTQLARVVVGPDGVILPLLNAIIVYTGTLGAVQLQNNINLPNSPALDIFKTLLGSFEAEGRYIILNCMVNQLRYPSNLTHFFSYVLLLLFVEAENEILPEQITRVLLERLIAQRPHPWGLIITFIELLKNPRYGFWRKSFRRCAPEIEQVFEAVARSCLTLTPSSASTSAPTTSSMMA